jgi:hypothetical protein
MNIPTIRAWCRARRLRRIPALLTGAVVTMASGAAYALGAAAGATLQDIHDIRPPFHISQAWLWFLGIGGWLVLMLLASLLWSWRRRKAQALRLSAHELALARLREAQALMRPEQARAFSLAVSGVIRAYIEQRFDIQAAHRTTPEFLRDCVTEAGGLLAPHRQILELFLTDCDLAKFAGWILSVPEMDDMLASAVNFVIESAQTPPLTPKGPAHHSQRGKSVLAPEAAAS